MRRRVIADAGPIVAFIDRGDAHHRWTRDEARNFAGPWLTAETAVTEAWHLLRHSSAAQDALLEMLRRSYLQIGFIMANEVEALQSLCRRFRNVPMSLADASLVRTTELHDGYAVVTFDSDFTIYRKNGREPIDLVMPPA